MNEECDNAICELAQGNKNALSVIYREYGRMIYSVGYNIVKNSTDAEDVLQETMMKILKQAHTYRRGTNPKAWVMSIARSCAIDVAKKQNNDSPLEDVEFAVGANESADEMLLIKDAMKRLSAEERTVINLKLYVGLSHSEIASVLGINLFAVQKKYRRALAKLKKYCEE